MLVKVNNNGNRSFNGLMNELFNDLPATFGKTMKADGFGFPPVNISETADNYQLQLAVPGWEKADFNIKLDGNILTVSTEKKEEKKDEAVKMIRKEFSSRSFTRSFTVDDKIEASSISAKYENGLLQIALPKKEEVKNVAKEINIQ